MDLYTTDKLSHIDVDVVRRYKMLCFGIVLTPQNMIRPPWKDLPVPKAPVIAIPRRAYGEKDEETTKKPRTATVLLLEDTEKSREADKVIFKEILTAIQARWACRVASCNSSTRFCWVHDDEHYHLSPDDLSVGDVMPKKI